MSIAMNSTPAPAILAPSAGSPDLEAIKARQRATWASGDYAMIGATLQIVAERLCEAADVRSVDRALDVATGHGNTALAAARRFADVVGVDYVPALLERARERASAERLPVEFREGDAEELPFEDASMDVVLSTFGVMFAPDHPRTAAELLRVCRPGGRIGLANWTPGGFIGQLLKTVGQQVPPPPGLRSPTLWGDEDHLQKLFAAGARTITANRRTFAFRYRSAAHFIGLFREFYGPVHKAFLALDADRQAVLHGEIEALIARHDQGAGRGLVVPSEYLEVVITRA